MGPLMDAFSNNGPILFLMGPLIRVNGPIFTRNGRATFTRVGVDGLGWLKVAYSGLRWLSLAEGDLGYGLRWCRVA